MLAARGDAAGAAADGDGGADRERGEWHRREHWRRPADGEREDGRHPRRPGDLGRRARRLAAVHRHGGLDHVAAEGDRASSSTRAWCVRAAAQFGGIRRAIRRNFPHTRSRSSSRSQPHKGINALEMCGRGGGAAQIASMPSSRRWRRRHEYRFMTCSTMKPTQVKCAVGSLNQLPPWVEISGDVRLTPFYEVPEAARAPRRDCGRDERRFENAADARAVL